MGQDLPPTSTPVPIPIDQLGTFDQVFDTALWLLSSPLVAAIVALLVGLFITGVVTSFIMGIVNRARGIPGPADYRD